MITTLQLPFKQILKDLRWPLSVITVLITILAVIDHYTKLNEVHIPIALISVPGTVIGLLLAFRTNSAYDRWWEARIIWGAIVNDSRTWVRQLSTFIVTKDKSLKDQYIIKPSYRQIAWNYALSRHLRREEVLQDVESFLSKEDYASLKDKSNVPNGLLYMQGTIIKNAFENGLVNQYQQIELDNTLRRLTDSMGKCERIKNTVFPASYNLLIEILIYLWIFLLPFGLVDLVGYILIPLTIVLSFGLLTIERIAVYMQNPFENTSSDTPMTSISRNIEINIREELGLRDIPDPMKPVNGVLM